MATFFLNIQRRVEPGLVASGKFDGSHACLAAATSGGNVLVHSPHRPPPTKDVEERVEGRLSWNGELAELRIGSQVFAKGSSRRLGDVKVDNGALNEQRLRDVIVTALCTGYLGEDERHVLLIGTATHVLAYHVDDNADIFYKEMSDGARSILIGKLGWLPNQVVIVGGTSSVTVLDSQGTEIFWTATSDAIISMAIFDFDGDGENELIVGTEDCEMKVHREDCILWEVKESAPIVTLTGLNGRQFAFGSGDGTIGVYENGQKLWRAKSKHKVISTKAFDLNADKTLELITGWSNGKVDVRTAKSGDVIMKIQLSSGVAGLMEADYRKIGRPDLITVSVSGEVRGYCPDSSIDVPEPGEVMRKLLARKQALQMELRQRTASISDLYHGPKLAVSIASAKGATRVSFAAGPGLLIQCAIVFADGIFEDGTYVSHPSRPRGELEIELRPPKNDPVDINVKVLVGPPGTDLFQVFEIVQTLPRFCMYEFVKQPENVSKEVMESGVTIEVAERPQRIALWLNQNLILSQEIEVSEDASNVGHLSVWLRGLRDDKFHRVVADSTGKVEIRTEDPGFAGDVVQSLATYLGLRELTSEAKFPNEERRMSDALERVKGLKEIDARLQAEAAGNSALVKEIVIRLEDARILEDVDEMRRKLTMLKNYNGDLIREHEIKMRSHRELMETLRELNLGVQRAAKLRVGKAASNTIARCRAAIQDENPKALILAIRYG